MPRYCLYCCHFHELASLLLVWKQIEDANKPIGKLEAISKTSKSRTHTHTHTPYLQTLGEIAVSANSRTATPLLLLPHAMRQSPLSRSKRARFGDECQYVVLIQQQQLLLLLRLSKTPILGKPSEHGSLGAWKPSILGA